MSASTFTKIIATAAIAGMVAPIALAKGPAEDVGPGARAIIESARAEGNRGSDNAERGGDNATTTGQQEREKNRSEVAARVQALLDVADRDGGIGQDVRDIAHEVASTSERADEAKASVERRPGWLTFIIGSDYGNLGKLRSELATTQNQIQRLTNAIDRATDISVKADLQTQVNALRVEASTTEEFVKDNESVFSIFGWFFKLFS